MNSPANIYALCLLLLLGLVTWRGVPAQDWIPFSAASSASVVYAPGELMSAEFQTASLDAYEAAGMARDEARVHVSPFVSPPLALPLSWLPVWAVRLLGAACLIFAFRRSGLGWEGIPMLIPSIHLLQVGQTTPILIAAAVAPVGLVGPLLALAVAFKASPALLLVPLVWHWRTRWLDLVLFGLVLCLLQLVLEIYPHGGAGWSAWLDEVHLWSAFTDGFDRNLAAPRWLSLLIAPIWLAALYREENQDRAWAGSWFAWLLLVPLCWGMYTAVLAFVTPRVGPWWLTLLAVAGSVLMYASEPVPGLCAFWVAGMFLALLAHHHLPATPKIE